MAVTPIDGRYHSRTRALAAYFSEFALIRYRVRVEIEWLFALAENPAIKEFTLDARCGATTAHALQPISPLPMRAASRNSSAHQP